MSSHLQYVYVNEEVSCIGCSLPGGVPAYSWTVNNSSAIGQAGAYILFNGSLLIQDPLALLLGATGVLTVQCYDQKQLLSYVAYVALSGEYIMCPFCMCGLRCVFTFHDCIHPDVMACVILEECKLIRYIFFACYSVEQNLLWLLPAPKTSSQQQTLSCRPCVWRGGNPFPQSRGHPPM